jgi:isoamylase
MASSSLPAPTAPPAVSWRGLPLRRPPPSRGPPLAQRAAARSCHYRFRTDDDSVLDVAVTRKDGHGGGYVVTVEVPARAREGGLVLRGVESAGETVPLAPAVLGHALTAELSFPADATLAPFHISFLLADAATGPPCAARPVSV